MRVLIAGQGLAGTAVAWRLREMGHDFLIIDPCEETTSSIVAAGLMTPITGKDLTPSWRFKTFYKQAVEFYRKLEKTLGSHLFYPTAISRIFINQSEKDTFNQAFEQDEFRQHVEQLDKFPKYVSAPHGGFTMPSGGRVNVKEIIKQSRNYFSQYDQFRKGFFDLDKVLPYKNHFVFEGEKFDRIVLCRGFRESNYMDHKALQFEPNRGQMLRVKTEQFVNDPVWNQRGLWSFREPERGSVLIGATYNRMQTSAHPSVTSFEQIIRRLRRYMELPNGSFKIINHPTGIRPIIRGWKLVAGAHPRINNLYLFNGLGSKGALRAPTFSFQLVNQIINGEQIDAGVDFGMVNNK